MDKSRKKEIPQLTKHGSHEPEENKNILEEAREKYVHLEEIPQQEVDPDPPDKPWEKKPTKVNNKNHLEEDKIELKVKQIMNIIMWLEEEAPQPTETFIEKRVNTKDHLEEIAQKTLQQKNRSRSFGQHGQTARINMGKGSSTRKC